MQHSVLSGGSQIFNRGQLRHKALVKGNHGTDLSLLKHDL